MRLLYFSLDFNTDKTKGIVKKVLGQKEGFESNGIKTDLIYSEDNVFYFGNKKNKLFNSKITDRFNFYYTSFKLKKDIFRNEYDTYYFRYSMGNIYLYLILFYLRLFFPKSKKIIEIPTYPYKQEVSNKLKNRLIIFIDELFNKFFAKRLINYYVTFSNHTVISNVSCINIKNGISPLTENFSIPNNNSDLTLIGVAGIEAHTGYDRIIEGMREYYHGEPETLVNFLIVGEGSLRNEWESRVNRYGLEKYIKFTGLKTGKELNSLYNKSTIGVSNIALFRKGNAGDSMKAKEYLKFGLPIIVDSADNYFDPALSYEVSSNDSKIDISKIILFREQVYNSTTREEISKYAVEEFSWKKQLKKIIDVINNDSK